MKNITTNKTIDNKNIVENKISLSLREFSKKRILFRLVNTKRNNTKSFNIYEKAKFSNNIEIAFNNSYRKIDIEYDTTKNNRFKKVNLLVDINSYLDKSKYKAFLDLSRYELISNNRFTFLNLLFLVLSYSISIFL